MKNERRVRGVRLGIASKRRRSPLGIGDDCASRSARCTATARSDAALRSGSAAIAAAMRARLSPVRLPSAQASS